MTLRRTEIIEWSTTPKELRRIADELAKPMTETVLAVTRGDIRLSIIDATHIPFDEGQWQAEQVEEDDGI